MDSTGGGDAGSPCGRHQGCGSGARKGGHVVRYAGPAPPVTRRVQGHGGGNQACSRTAPSLTVPECFLHNRTLSMATRVLTTAIAAALLTLTVDAQRIKVTTQTVPIYTTVV